MDKNVTKKGLLKLKKSKPIPITAHTGEIIIPVAYTETVKKMLDKKGIKLPLSKDKLAKLRKIAQKTDGDISESDEDEGESFAKGTANLKGQTININIDTQKKRKRRRKGKGRKTKLSLVSGLVKAPEDKGLLKPLRTDNLNVLRPSTFEMIRPITYSANTPVLDYKKVLDENLEKEKVAVKKREEELKEDVSKKNKRIDALEKSYEEERKRTEAVIRQDLLVPRLEKKYKDSDEERVEDDRTVIDDIINDIKEFKKSKVSLEQLKRDVLDLMETYKMGTLNKSLTEEEEDKIFDKNNHQDIYSEFLAFARHLADQD